MSKFDVGDRVRVVSLTDLDAERDDPKRVITDNALAAAVFGPGIPAIGALGTVVEVLCDYYDCVVQMDEKASGTGGDLFAFPETDLEAAE